MKIDRKKIESFQDELIVYLSIIGAAYIFIMAFWPLSGVVMILGFMCLIKWIYQKLFP